MPSRLIFGYALAVVLVVACSHDNQATDTGPLALTNGEWSGDDSYIEGPLVLEHGCLYLDNRADPKFTTRYIPAFSGSGTSWDEKAQAVHIPGRTLEVGAMVKLRGGEGPLSYSGWSVPPKPECTGPRAWIVGL